MRIYLYTKALDEIHRIMDQYPENLECGGHLYGYTSSPNDVCVAKVFPPGKGFKPNPNEFDDGVQDGVWDAMTSFFNASNFGWHLGHWHTHPLPGPIRRSGGDITNGRNWFNWYQNASYTPPNSPMQAFVGMIVHRWRGKREFGAWIYNRAGDHHAEIVDWDGQIGDEDHVENYLSRIAS